MKDRLELAILITLIVAALLLVGWIDPGYNGRIQDAPYPPPATIGPYPEPSVVPPVAPTATAKPKKDKPAATEADEYRPTSAPTDDDW